MGDASGVNLSSIARVRTISATNSFSETSGSLIQQLIYSNLMVFFISNDTSIMLEEGLWDLF